MHGKHSDFIRLLDVVQRFYELEAVPCNQLVTAGDSWVFKLVPELQCSQQTNSDHPYAGSLA